MKRTILSVLLTLAIFTTGILSTACTPKQLETFKAVSNGVVATANGIQITLQSFSDQRKLTDSQAAFVKVYLSSALAQIGKINSLVQAVNKWPPSNAGEVIDAINQVLSLIDESIQQGVLKFGNDATMQKVGLTLAILKGALGSIKSLLGGAPVSASVLDDMRSDKAQLEEVNTDLLDLLMEMTN